MYVKAYVCMHLHTYVCTYVRTYCMYVDCVVLTGSATSHGTLLCQFPGGASAMAVCMM